VGRGGKERVTGCDYDQSTQYLYKNGTMKSTENCLKSGGQEQVKKE
jgi:hypothetical protein